MVEGIRAIGRKSTIVAVALACLLGPAGAAKGAGFSMTPGTLGTARTGALHVLLPNGKVLIAGGVTGGSIHLASAELFDPAKGTFAPTGSMPAPRTGASAVLLKDGRVLIAGGFKAFDLGQYVATALLYDYRTGQFTTTGSLQQTRGGGTAILLKDGRVLVAGGSMAGSFYFDEAEIYDPATGKFTVTGSMSSRRDYFGAALLPDGRVLVAGGYGGQGAGSALSSADIYDPATGTFKPTGSLGTARQRTKLVALANGRVLVVAGWNGDSIASAEVYDPKARTFTPTGSLEETREFPSVIALPDGRVLIAGGGHLVNGLYETIENTEIYDPATGYFTPAGKMNQARGGGASGVLLTNGKVLFAGGGGGNVPFATAETWAGPLPTARIVARPPASIKSSRATFRFASNGYSPGFRCVLDKGSWKACPSVKTVAGLKRGRHVMTVQSVSLGVPGKPVAWAWNVT